MGDSVESVVEGGWDGKQLESPVQKRCPKLNLNGSRLNPRGDSATLSVCHKRAHFALALHFLPVVPGAEETIIFNDTRVEMDARD